MDLRVKNYHLRPVNFTPADLAGILEVYRLCEDFLALGPVAVASPEIVQADLDLSQKQGGTFHVIEDSRTGKMVGVVDYMLSGFEGDPEVVDLGLLMIGVPYRGQGLGEEVTHAVENEICTASQAKAIHTGCQVNNTGGIRFWQRMGNMINSGPVAFPDGTTAYQFIKKIIRPSDLANSTQTGPLSG
jgi:hypothetical protein